MSADAMGLMVILGMASGLAMVCGFMFVYAMVPPHDAPEWRPSSYDPMAVLLGRAAARRKRKSTGEPEMERRAA
jgi:hypothetical protein